MRNAGAPITVMVVPSEAANDIGMRSLEAGIFRARDTSSITGSMMAVVVTWWVNAERTATAGMSTATARVQPAPASRATPRPSTSDTPVRCSAALSTKIAATTIAGSLLNPARAVRGSSRPVTTSASTMSTATRSLRSRSVSSSTNAAARMTKNTSCGVTSAVTSDRVARAMPGRTLTPCRADA
jgi:hypothetical protein